MPNILCDNCGSGTHDTKQCPKVLHDPVNQALRYNAGKNRLHLIPPIVLIELGKHYTYGAGKYHDHNWMTGLPYGECYGSLLRHLFAWYNGESTDEESGSHHLIAVIWNAVTLFYYELFPSKYSKFDDRPWAASGEFEYEFRNPSFKGQITYTTDVSEDSKAMGQMIQRAIDASPACPACGGKFEGHFSWCATQTTKPKPPEGYARLSNTDIIQEGDLFWANNGGTGAWIKIADQYAGNSVGHWDKWMARKFESEKFKIPATEIRK